MPYHHACDEQVCPCYHFGRDLLIVHDRSNTSVHQQILELTVVAVSVAASLEDVTRDANGIDQSAGSFTESNRGDTRDGNGGHRGELGSEQAGKGDESGKRAHIEFGLKYYEKKRGRLYLRLEIAELTGEWLERLENSEGRGSNGFYT